MKVTFIIGHPAHVHIFKHVIRDLESDGHEVNVLSRNRGIISDLLNAYDINHINISTKRDGIVSTVLEVAQRDLLTFAHALKCRPDCIVGQFSPFAAHASILPGVASLILEINEKPKYLSMFVSPFADEICSPTSFGQDRGERHYRYEGFHELAYLHPNWFNPDKERLQREGIAVNDNYYVLRFVSWDAYHDVGHQGISNSQRRELVEFLDARGTVYISTEGEIDEELEQYEITIPPDLMHDLLHYADLYVGDSGTVPIEAGILGTPALCVNELTEEYGIFDELQNEYGIVDVVTEYEELVDRVHEITEHDRYQEIWKRRRDRLIYDKDDLTQVLSERIRKYGGE